MLMLARAYIQGSIKQCLILKGTIRSLEVVMDLCIISQGTSFGAVHSLLSLPDADFADVTISVEVGDVASVTFFG